MWNELRKLFQLTHHLKKYILFLILRSPVDALITVINAMFLQNAFAAAEHSDLSRLIHACLLFFFASLSIFLYNGTVWSLNASFVVKITSILKKKVFEKITKKELMDIDNKPLGFFITLLNTDIQLASNLLMGPITIIHFITASMKISISAFLILKINPHFLLIVSAFVIPHIIFARIVIARPMTNLKSQSQKALAANASALEPIITSADMIYLYDASALALKEFMKTSLAVKNANMKMHKRNALANAVLPLFGMGGYLIILLTGAGFISSGDMAFGDLTAIFQYRGGILLGSMMISNCMANIHMNLAGVKHINEV